MQPPNYKSLLEGFCYWWSPVIHKCNGIWWSVNGRLVINYWYVIIWVIWIALNCQLIEALIEIIQELLWSVCSLITWFLCLFYFSVLTRPSGVERKLIRLCSSCFNKIIINIKWVSCSTFRVSCRSSMLLLAPLLAETDPAPHRVSRPTSSAGAQRTEGLCSHFRWMAEHVPAFRVPGSHVHILTSPNQFYQAMKVCLRAC